MMEQTPHMEKFEERICAFLKENDDKIIIKDIKYRVDTPNPITNFGITGLQW